MRSKKKFIDGLFVVSVGCLVALVLLFGVPVARRLAYPVRYVETVTLLSERYSLDPLLVYAVIKTESDFDERAQSVAGAKGLMQITDSTAAYIAERRKVDRYDLFLPEDNLEFGCWYLRYLFDRFSDERTALAAYNAGEGTVRQWLKNSAISADGSRLDSVPYRETAEYLGKIMRNYEKYRKYYPQFLDKKEEMR